VALLNVTFNSGTEHHRVISLVFPGRGLPQNGMGQGKRITGIGFVAMALKL